MRGCPGIEATRWYLLRTTLSTSPRSNPMTSRLLLRQPMMRAVLWALLPSYLAAIVLYGWRSGVVVLLCMASAVVAEGAFLWPRRPVSEAALVTGALLGMSLPPRVPLWVGPVGSCFAIVFGKMVFGGFGMNPFNPAMVGRAFVYMAFPLVMTSAWAQPGWSLASWSSHAVTGATPLVAFEEGQRYSPWRLLVGLEPGSLGEGCRVLLLLGGLALLAKRYARWRLVVSTLTGALGVACLLWVAHVPQAPDPLFALLSGGLIMGAFFIATDPVSSPRTAPADWVYGVLIGAVTMLIRVYGAFSEGLMFAVLLGNAVAPVVDWWILEHRKGGA